MKFTADFETTTDANDCRVWAWAVCEIGNPDNFIYGTDIDSFLDFLENNGNHSYYFHNLKFDGEFIMCKLFERGFKHIHIPNPKRGEKRKPSELEQPHSFTTLISDAGQFYTMKIIFQKKGKKSKYVKIYDSYKIIPFSVEDVAKAFNLPISKLEIDYKAYRAPGHDLTQEETDYLRNDVEIMARALDILFSQDLTKMTQGSNALYDFKQGMTHKEFQGNFPVPWYDADVRQSYKGGFTYLRPIYAGQDLGEGLVFDVNSLYPWAMRECPLPWGEGIWFDGEYVQDDLYNLYVQMFTCQFELKPGHIPTVQLKHVTSFIPTQYLESSADPDGDLQFVTMCMTSVDLALFREHYNVYNYTPHSGWKFKSSTNLFRAYIDKWTDVKIEASKTGNKAMRTLAKLMLNALYGKFGLNPKVCSKIPYYDNGAIRYTRAEPEMREPIYIPAATFITAWARDKTIRSAQRVYDKFVYADTDSLHLRIDIPESLKTCSQEELEKMTTADLQAAGLDIPPEFVIDPYALGAWKLESRFYRSRFLRQKCYLEDSNTPGTWNEMQYNSATVKKICENLDIEPDEILPLYKGLYDKAQLKITCSGMPKECYQYVTWDNYHVGATYNGKLQPQHVPGGIVLQDIEFTIRRT